MQYVREDLLMAYRAMRNIREFEERVHLEFQAGEIPGFVHLYSGQEACAVGICMDLRDDDWITSTHRGHGHCIAKGCDVRGMMQELYGKRGGICHGKGGSQHIADLSKGMLGANGIVGAGAPLACGAALSAKTQGSGAVSVAFVGDGGANQGATLESMNLAAVWKLPAIFVFENNGYAESTASEWAVACGDIVNRAEGFGMPGTKVDGHDFFAVYDAAREAIGRARKGDGPNLIEVKTNRFFGHYEGDTQTYRSAKEVETLRDTMDCLARFRTRVTEAGLLDAEELDQIDNDALRLIDDAVNSARAAAAPSAKDLLTDVYMTQ